MSEEAQDRVDLDFKRMFCSRHGEPFRQEWPKGALKTQTSMVERLIVKASAEESAKLREEARRLLDRPAEAAISNKEMLEALFSKKPMCCRLGDKIMRGLWERAGIGRVGRCVVCRRKNRKCVEVKMRTSTAGDTQTLDRVCFDCVLRHLHNGPVGN